MKTNQNLIEEKINEAVRLFWQVIPPIWHTARAMTHQIATDEFNISVSQFHTLRKLADGKRSVSDLAECMHLSRSNISRSVDELVNAGYVNREQDLIDRRNVNLTLTVDGKKIIDAVLGTVGTNLKNKFIKLGYDELDEIAQGLNLLQKVFVNNETSESKNEKIN